MMRIGVKNLFLHKLRTALTMLGVIFGVGAVIAMLSIGEGARRQAVEQIRLLGTNNIRIHHVELGGEAAAAADYRYSPGLTAGDEKMLRAKLPTLCALSAIRFLDVSVQRAGHEPAGVVVVGVNDEYDDLTNSRTRRGRFISWLDARYARRVCVLGAEIARDLFGVQDALDRRVRIGEEEFLVVGVMERKSVATGGVLEMRNINRDVYIPVAAALKRFTDPDFPDRVDEIAVQVSDAASVVPSSRVIDRILEKSHRGVHDYEIVIPDELLAQSQRTQRIFNIVMGSIAALSLLVGGIGIMNIMLASVTERTREIGIRRAIGASERDILGQFLNETLLIALAGGLIGIVLGAGMAFAIHLFASWETVVSPVAVLVSFGISASVGVIFGLYPARQAAQKDPIEALRYE
ncbi:MAG: ABC transporter permease [Candidatus Latescibacterota bacterium]|nr:MAG: ABC transporter permease [Candidatus Latescibacterota bacterium]